MHIITGMIANSLMGKIKGKPQSVLHGSSSPVRLTHSIPGRSRFHLSDKARTSFRSEQLSNQLNKIEGISKVVADSRTGSITIYHDPVNVKTDLLAAAIIRLLGLENLLKTAPQPTFTREARRLGNAFNSAVYDKTGGFIDLWSMLPLAFIILGVRKLITDRSNIMPTGLTLLWWGYNSLFRGGNGKQ
jgi:hypothetical protein